jgi:hypothetical protein
MTDYYYRIIFRIRHPSIDPGALTKKLRMTPRHFGKVGEYRILPNGDVLKTRNKDTFWSYRDEYRGRSRNFFKRVERLANNLKPHRAFLHEISTAGGKCEIYVQLPGITNIGDSLYPQALQILAELDIVLSVELFPDWKLAPQAER